MARPLRTDVAARVLAAWAGVGLLGCVAVSPALLLWMTFSVPFAMIAVLLALWFGDHIVLHPRRWALAAIVLPMLATSLVFGWGALLSLLLSVPVAAAFLLINRKWPVRRLAA